MNKGEVHVMVEANILAHSYRDVDPNHKMLEGGPVRATVGHSTALALSNHDKGGSGVTVEASVMAQRCAIG